MRFARSTTTRSADGPKGLLARFGSGVAAMALAVTAPLVACGDSGDRELTAEEAALLDDERYVEGGVDGANGGAIMDLDETLSLAVASVSTDEAELQVFHADDQSLNTTVEVDRQSVFTVGDYRIKVVSLSDDNINIEWARLES